MGNSTMLGRSASVAQKSASPCMQLLNTSIQQQNVQPARGMANLKAIAIRLKSVKNIQKITQSMKMVSAAKYARAERDLKKARPYGTGAQAFYDQAKIGEEAEGAPAAAGGKELYVAITSDRGLCGGVHSSICKTINNTSSQANLLLSPPPAYAPPTPTPINIQSQSSAKPSYAPPAPSSMAQQITTIIRPSVTGP